MANRMVINGSDFTPDYSWSACQRTLCIHWNSYGYGDIQIADKLKEVLEADGKERIIHIYEGDTPYIEQVQFRMQDRKIDIWDAREKDINPAKLQEGDKLILAADSKYREIFDKLYERSWEAGHLCLYYNP